MDNPKLIKLAGLQVDMIQELTVLQRLENCMWSTLMCSKTASEKLTPLTAIVDLELVENFF